MIQSLRLFFKQGRQYIGNLFTAQVDKKYRGFPQFKADLCSHCGKCISVCPVKAISNDLTIDMGKCQFCGECVRVCPSGAANFCNFHHTGTTDREKLKVAAPEGQSLIHSPQNWHLPMSTVKSSEIA